MDSNESGNAIYHCYWVSVICCEGILKGDLIVQLRGNLGNQLYQWIAGLELVNGDSSKVLLDTRLCKDYGAYALPKVIKTEYLQFASHLDLASVGEIPVRWVGFRTLLNLQHRFIDPCVGIKAECGWYGRNADANQCRLDGKEIRFVRGMFQDRVYYRNALQYISEYSKPSIIDDRYDLAISLRQGDDYRDFGIRLGRTYYCNAMQVVNWDNVQRIAVTGDRLPPWDLFSIIPKGIVVHNYIGTDQECQFSILRNSMVHVMANSTFSWWATLFGQATNGYNECYACSNWFKEDQVSLIGAICVPTE